MMRRILGIPLVVFGHLTFGQPEVLRGFITANGAPIHGAHIYNHTTKLLTITDTDGTFSLPASPSDSLQISYIGYETVAFVVDASLLSETLYISMKSNAVLLEEVAVSFPSYLGFKEQVLDTQPSDAAFQVDGLDQVDYTQVSFPEAPSTQDADQVLPSGGVGARFDLDGVTKRGKEKKKYKKLKERERLLEQAHQKFTRTWVEKVTKLKGERLTDFISYCSFTPEYIVETPIYILREDMMVLLDRFTSEKYEKYKDQKSP